MSMWTDAKKTAMQTEEAALLPAMGRGMAGWAALEAVLRESGKIAGKQTAEQPEGTKEDSLGIGAKKPGRLMGRAALRQVWKGHDGIRR